MNQSSTQRSDAKTKPEMDFTCTMANLHAWLGLHANQTIARVFQTIARGFSSHQWPNFDSFRALEGPVHTQGTNQAVYRELKVDNYYRQLQ
jgi:hypothetical protein